MAHHRIQGEGLGVCPRRSFFTVFSHGQPRITTTLLGHRSELDVASLKPDHVRRQTTPAKELMTMFKMKHSLIALCLLCFGLGACVATDPPSQAENNEPSNNMVNNPNNNPNNGSDRIKRPKGQEQAIGTDREE
jgi:hypothetical protein